MKLINCGCSFAHGYNGNLLKDYEPINLPGLAEPKDNGFESAGWHIAQAHALDYVDLARNGNSNEAILRNLRSYLHHNGPDDLFVLIGWTHAFRREYMTWNTNTERGEFVQYREVPQNDSFLSKLKRLPPMMVPFNERRNRPLSYDDHTEHRQYNIMLQTQQMLRLLKIPYVMYNACGSEHKSDNQAVLEIKEQIDKSSFYDFGGPGYDQYLQDNPHLLSKDQGHPDPSGHMKLAELLSPVCEKVLTAYNKSDIIKS